MDATPRPDVERGDPVPHADAESDSIWSELERLAKSIAHRAAHENGGPGGASHGERPLAVGELAAGTVSARCKVLDDPDGKTVVLVAIQHRERGLPHADELCARFHLTPTEARVALMLAERKTNREIAAALVVTQHTARRHTEKVLLRLGIRRRTSVRDAILRTGVPGR